MPQNLCVGEAARAPHGACATDMRDRDTRRRDVNAAWGYWLGPNALLVGAVVASAAVIGGHAIVLPPLLVLPALSVTFIIAAVGLAAFAWLMRSERAGAGITCWDVSGALYFFSCCAAVLGEAEGLLALIEEIKVRK